MKKKTLVVVGEIFSSNLGDYAIYNSLKDRLTSKGYEVIPLDLSYRKGWPVDMTKTEHMYQKTNLKLASLFPKRLKHAKAFQRVLSRVLWKFSLKQKSYSEWYTIISKADGVIIGGGQLITDSTAYFAPKLDLVRQIAKTQNKPIAILGCGVGQDIKIIAKLSYRKLLNEAVYISVRDKESRQKIINHIGTKNSVEINPDLAFALEDVSNATTSTDGSICAFNVMPLDFFKKFNPSLANFSETDYLEFWYKLALSAIDKNMRIVIMTNGSISDHAQAEVIAHFLTKKDLKVELLPRPTRPEMVYQQISTIDLLVGTRMHAGIIAYALGKPVTALTWDRKIPDVWTTIGCPSIAVDSSIFITTNPWQTIQNSLNKSNECQNNRDCNRATIDSSIEKCLLAMNLKN